MSRGPRTALWMAATFAACAALFYAMLAAQPGVLDIDGMYHFKVARLIRERGPWVDISWLPFTVLGGHGPDHEWLYHALLAPFTWLGEDLRALQLTAAIACAAVPAALLGLLRGANAPFAPAFALAAVASNVVLPGRFLTLRTETLAVILMAAALFALARRRAVLAGAIAFVFMQAYHGAVILAPMVAIALAVQLWRERRVSLRPLLAVTVGLFAGLLASPWFPDNVRFLVFHVFFKAAAGMPELAGTEWLPMSAPALLLHGWVGHLLLASGLAAAAVAARTAPRPFLGEDTLAAVALAFLLLAMYRFAWRFAEYYGPFCAISAALLWRDALRGRSLARASRGALGFALAALAAVGLVQGNDRIQAAKSGDPDPFEAFAGMIAYVEAHDPAPMVFDTRWSDFQQMVYWAKNARFVAGLDGHFLLYGDPKRFQAWYAIATGATASRTDNAQRIRETFGARWVVVSRDYPFALPALSNDPGARLVMERPEGWLFDLRAGP
jgi:hypothetical protein